MQLTGDPVVALSAVAGDHAYVDALAAESATELPRQMDWFPLVNTVGSAELLIVKLEDAVQLFASVTVTVYVPAARLLTDADDCELLHA